MDKKIINIGLLLTSTTPHKGTTLRWTTSHINFTSQRYYVMSKMAYKIVNHVTVWCGCRFRVAV